MAEDARVSVEMHHDNEDTFPDRLDPVISFHDIDPSIHSPQRHRVTRFGVVRIVSSIQVLEWVFVALASAGIIATFVFAIYSLGTESVGNSDYILSWLILIHAVFCILYLLNGVLAERLPEILIIVITTLILMVYATADFAMEQIPVKLARIIVSWLLGVPVIGLAVYISYLCNINCMIFHIIGSANSELISMVKKTFFYQSFLKFDMQTSVSLLVAVMHLHAQGAPIEGPEIATIVVAIVFIFAWTAAGYCAIRYENKIVLAVFAAASTVLLLGFLIWKSIDSDFQKLGKYYVISFVISAVTACLSHLILMALSPLVGKSFGRGIKEILYEGKSPDHVLKPSNPEAPDKTHIDGTRVSAATGY